MKFAENLQTNLSMNEGGLDLGQNSGEKVNVKKEITFEQRKDFVKEILNRDTVGTSLKGLNVSFNEDHVSFMADLLDSFTIQKGLPSMREGLAKINNNHSFSENERKAIALVLSTQVSGISDFLYSDTGESN